MGNIADILVHRISSMSSFDNNLFIWQENIFDRELLDIVNKLEEGQPDADLGAGVFKMRIARSGKGKLGAYRVIVFFKSEKRTFYVHGFAKSNTGANTVTSAITYPPPITSPNNLKIPGFAGRLKFFELYRINPGSARAVFQPFQ